MKNSLAATTAALLALNESTITATGSVRDFTVMHDRLKPLTRQAKTQVGSKRTLKPEIMYRDLIKAGIVKVERRRGQPPKIIWL